ncbi:MAG: mandelate racemase/muconate lactonizing enzyme family protein [Acidobacteriota bacterium]
MKITAVTAYAVKIPRDLATARGTAGSPAPLRNHDGGGAKSDYHFAATYQTLYSTKIETALIKVETDAGITGWGEAQAPLAPEIVCTIIETLLAPLLVGEDPLAHERLWSRMYNSMRVRGHTGSFLLDAIAGIDIALWDIKGKALNVRCCDLLGGPFADKLPTYISGLAGRDIAERVANAAQYHERGFDAFKLFLDGTTEEMLDLIDALRARLPQQTKIMVDALWRLGVAEAIKFGKQLDARGVLWLEAPLPPEEVRGLAQIAASIDAAVAMGECWRTRWELKPFFDAGAVEILQPDIGRSGITEGMKLAALAEMHAVRLAFHVSIGLGVQIAAALHVAASIPNLMFVECNPQVWQVAESLLKASLPIGAGTLGIPEGTGLGIEIDEEKLQPFIVN